MCIPIIGLPFPARHLQPSCHVVSAEHWAIFFWYVATHRLGYLGQAPLPSAGHSWGFSIGYILWMPQCCLLQSCWCPGWVLEVPEVGEMVVVSMWGHRSLPKEYKYGPKSNRWKLQILSPTVTLPSSHPCDSNSSDKHHADLTAVPSLIHWPGLFIWPSLPLELVLPGRFLHLSFK